MVANANKKKHPMFNRSISCYSSNTVESGNDVSRLGMARTKWPPNKENITSNTSGNVPKSSKSSGERRQRREKTIMRSPRTITWSGNTDSNSVAPLSVANPYDTVKNCVTAFALQSKSPNQRREIKQQRLKMSLMRQETDHQVSKLVDSTNTMPYLGPPPGRETETSNRESSFLGHPLGHKQKEKQRSKKKSSSFLFRESWDRIGSTLGGPFDLDLRMKQSKAELRNPTSKGSRNLSFEDILKKNRSIQKITRKTMLANKSLLTMKYPNGRRSINNDTVGRLLKVRSNIGSKLVNTKSALIKRGEKSCAKRQKFKAPFRKKIGVENQKGLPVNKLPIRRISFDICTNEYFPNTNPRQVHSLCGKKEISSNSKKDPHHRVSIGDAENYTLFSSGGQKGWQDIYSDLVAEKVDISLMKENWVKHHYKWAVWRRAREELRCPGHEKGIGQHLNYAKVFEEFKYRYEWELNRSHRSPLHLIYEMDESPSRHMVLLVAKVDEKFSNVLLFDGWYSMNAKLDDALKYMFSAGKIKIGNKLRIAGASLDKDIEATSPLSIKAANFTLQLRVNGTQRASIEATLGFQSSGNFLVRLGDLHASGGNAPMIRVVVMKRYPTMYLSDKIHRTMLAEADAERAFKSKQEIRLHKLQDEVKIKVGLDRATQLTSEEWTRLQDQFEVEFNQAVSQDPKLKRKATPYFKALIREVLPCGRLGHSIAEYQVWRPREAEIQCLKAGNYLEIFGAAVSRSCRTRNVSLSNSKHVRYKIIQNYPVLTPVGDIKKQIQRNLVPFHSVVKLPSMTEVDVGGFVLMADEPRKVSSGHEWVCEVFLAQCSRVFAILEIRQTDTIKHLIQPLEFGQVVLVKNCIYSRHEIKGDRWYVRLGTCERTQIKRRSSCPLGKRITLMKQFCKSEFGQVFMNKAKELVEESRDPQPRSGFFYRPNFERFSIRWSNESSSRLIFNPSVLNPRVLEDRYIESLCCWLPMMIRWETLRLGELAYKNKSVVRLESHQLRQMLLSSCFDTRKIRYWLSQIREKGSFIERVPEKVLKKRVWLFNTMSISCPDFKTSYPSVGNSKWINFLIFVLVAGTQLAKSSIPNHMQLCFTDEEYDLLMSELCFILGSRQVTLTRPYWDQPLSMSKEPQKVKDISFNNNEDEAEYLYARMSCCIP